MKDRGVWKEVFLIEKSGVGVEDWVEDRVEGWVGVE
jgi:hypothetical protein